MTASSNAVSYDLTACPWVLVRHLDGSAAELSLREVLARAHAIRDVRGDLPTQAFAVVRLLLAVLHRAVRPLSQHHDAVDLWSALWEAPELPPHPCEDYLDTHAHRFDLFHPEHPFLQVADLRTAKGETFALDRLVADVPTNMPIFTTRTGPGLARLGAAEAARWLVHAHAFDTSGIKSGAIGDVRVKNGKGYGIGVGWAGALGGVLVEGATLRETLLLNLVLRWGNDLERGIGPDDLPVWERPPITAAVERAEGTAPTGPVDLLTWPSRRIRLVRDGHDVVGVVLSNGDRRSGANQLAEQFTAWRYSEPQSKQAGGGPVYLPRTHDPTRSLWRGLASLLPQSLAGEGSDPPRSRPPGVLRWLDLLQERGALSDDHVLRLRAIGMAYGSNDSVVAEVIDEAMTFRSVLVAESGRELALLAVDSAEQAEQAVRQLVQLAANLAVAAGGESGRVRDWTREETYHRLDGPYREWLATLGPDTRTGDGLLQARQQWTATVRTTALAYATELLATSGPAAWIGREPPGRQHVSTAEADIWFRAALASIAPAPPRSLDRPASPHLT